MVFPPAERGRAIGINTAALNAIRINIKVLAILDEYGIIN